MRRPGLDGACWPDPDIDAVLRAALLDHDHALEAWAQVRPGLDLEGDLLWDVPRLLPLVLANLGADAVGDDAPRMKGLHREAWRDNQLHVHHAPRWLDPLAGEMPVALLKGMPLALDVYPDLGRRPMSDVDVLVPTDRIDRAMDVLVGHGWIGAADQPLPRSWRARHSFALVHPSGGHIDLHRVPGAPFLRPPWEHDPVASVWEAARPMEFAGRQVLVPAPEDLLLQVIVHGLTSVGGSSSRWVADATLLLRRRAVDWDRFVAEARRHRVVLAARSALRYLVDQFAAPVPGDALFAAWAQPVSTGDRHRFETVTATRDAVGFAGTRALVGGKWARLRTAVGPAGAAVAAPRFTADVLRVEHTWQIPSDVARRLRARVTRHRER
jgi:hypothetical protein